MNFVEAVSSVLDIMDYMKTYDIPGLLLFKDFEKALTVWSGILCSIV